MNAIAGTETETGFDAMTETKQMAALLEPLTIEELTVLSVFMNHACRSLTMAKDYSGRHIWEGDNYRDAVAEMALISGTAEGLTW